MSTSPTMDLLHTMTMPIMVDRQLAPFQPTENTPGSGLRSYGNITAGELESSAVSVLSSRGSSTVTKCALRGYLVVKVEHVYLLTHPHIQHSISSEDQKIQMRRGEAVRSKSSPTRQPFDNSIRRVPGTRGHTRSRLHLHGADVCHTRARPPHNVTLRLLH